MSSFRSRFPMRMSYSQAGIFILLTLFLISGPWLGWVYFQRIIMLKQSDPRFKVIAISQSNTKMEFLDTAYLAELLELSTDRPINLYRFNTQEAEKILEKEPLIKKATVSRIPPGTLLIDATIRMPKVFLGNFSNMAIDAEGVLIPFKPFFTPKRLPEIILEEKEVQGLHWGNKLESASFNLAMDVLQAIQQDSSALSVKLIDMKHAFSTQYGQKEIIVVVEKDFQDASIPKIHYLRLSTKNFKQELSYYGALFQHLDLEMLKSISIIDLRVPETAYLITH